MQPESNPPDCSAKRVILVGNGPSILQCGGAVIDAFDEIVRFNNFTTAGFEKQAGSRITLWSVTGGGSIKKREDKPQRIVVMHGQPPYEPEVLYRLPRKFYDAVRSSVQFLSAHNGQAMERLLPTSGLLVALWFLESCKASKVTLAGFDHFSKVKNKQHHYWSPGAYKKPQEHDGEVEANIFKRLVEAGKVEYLTV